MTVLAKAINAAGKTDPKAIREALLAIRGHEGAEGTYNFDQNGDGLHGYNVVRNDKGRFTLEHDIRYFDAKGKQIQPEKAEAKAKKDDKGSDQMWLLLLTLGGAGLIAVRMRRRSPVPAQVAIA